MQNKSISLPYVRDARQDCYDNGANLHGLAQRNSIGHTFYYRLQ
jgi:hypothetical protein